MANTTTAKAPTLTPITEARDQLIAQVNVMNKRHARAQVPDEYNRRPGRHPDSGPVEIAAARLDNLAMVERALYVASVTLREIAHAGTEHEYSPEHLQPAHPVDDLRARIFDVRDDITKIAKEHAAAVIEEAGR